MGHRRQLTPRALREALGALARAVDPSGGSLEVTLPAQEGARTLAAALLSEGAMRRHPLPPVAPGDRRGVAAFLDGVQESRVLAYAGTIPVVHGRVGAVVRARVDRRLVTWGDAPLTDEAVYAPAAALPAGVRDLLTEAGLPLVDTTDDALPPDEVHPQQMLRRAVHQVQRAREALEQSLGESWCTAAPEAPLYIDGGLPPSGVLLGGALAIGVIKSHHTLYAAGAALATVMSLGAGERSSLFVVETRWRDPVASWYVRVRPPGGHDPLWGLVRLEVSPAALATLDHHPDVAADLVSQWVAREAAPLALPDARWDTMAYGIRDCEVYLRSVIGRTM